MTTDALRYQGTPFTSQRLARLEDALRFCPPSGVELGEPATYPEPSPSQTSTSSLASYPRECYLQCRQMAYGFVTAVAFVTDKGFGTKTLTSPMRDLGSISTAPLASAVLEQQELVADFYAPLRFDWYDGEAEVIEAVRRDSESFYADR
jgi:hypothetical protein